MVASEIAKNTPLHIKTNNTKKARKIISKILSPHHSHTIPITVAINSKDVCMGNAEEGWCPKAYTKPTRVKLDVAKPVRPLDALVRMSFVLCLRRKLLFVIIRICCNMLLGGALIKSIEMC